MNVVPDANRNRNEQTKEDVLLPSHSRHLRENRPESTLCGHPKQGIQGAWNQSLATWVELGFLAASARSRCLRFACSTSSNRTSGSTFPPSNSGSLTHKKDQSYHLSRNV